VDILAQRRYSLRPLTRRPVATAVTQTAFSLWIIWLGLIGIVALLRLLVLLRILLLPLRRRILLWILLLIGIAIGTGNPVAVPIIRAVGAGLRSGDLAVRIAWIVGITGIVGVTGTIGVAWVTVSIRSAKAEVETSAAIISAIARPSVITGSRVASSAIVARSTRIAAPSDRSAGAHKALSSGVMASAGIAARGVAAIPAGKALAAGVAASRRSAGG